jgi:hypothetical protein
LCLGFLAYQTNAIASCRNAEKGRVHKTQSGRTLLQTLHKRELHAPGYPFKLMQLPLHEKAAESIVPKLLHDDFVGVASSKR